MFTHDIPNRNNSIYNKNDRNNNPSDQSGDIFNNISGKYLEAGRGGTLYSFNAAGQNKGFTYLKNFSIT